jgi:ATP-dependent RNA helicase DDX18/HAS1
LEKLISENYSLHMSAKEAFKAFVRAYDSHQMKTIFDIQTLDLGKLALSFGFRRPPNVGLSEYILIFFTWTSNLHPFSFIQKT